MFEEIKRLSQSPDFYGNRPRIIHHVFEMSNDTKDIEDSLGQKIRYVRNGLAIFTISHCVRRTLPYGIWTCVDGRQVVFNREYQAIAQRVNGVVSYANRDEAVLDIDSATMIYDDATDPCTYLLKHLGYVSLSLAESKVHRKALFCALRVLKEFTPTEHASVNDQWSVLGY